MVDSALFSSQTDEWETPISLFNQIDNVYSFGLDPCASKDNAKCSVFFDKDANGLSKNWYDYVVDETDNYSVFVNPPHSEIFEWAQKCYEESLSGITIVMLLASRTDTKYWHRYISNADTLYFIKGRLKFGNSKNSAPFPSVLAVFNNIKPYPVFEGMLGYNKIDG